MIDVPLVKRTGAHFKKNGVHGGSESMIWEETFYSAKIEMEGQEISLLLDTGSSGMYVIGSECVTYKYNTNTEGCRPFPKGQDVAGKCSMTHGFYNVETGHAINHHQTGKACYGDGAHLDFDTYSANVTINGIQAPNQIFGVITAQFEDMWLGHGILGLGYGSIIDTMAKAGHVKNEFAVCSNANYSWTNIQEGGRFIVGGGGLPDMKYTPIVPVFVDTYDRYQVYIETVAIDGHTVSHVDKDIDFTDNLALVDTGTNMLGMPMSWIRSFADVLCVILNKNQQAGGCTNSTGEDGYKFNVPNNMLFQPGYVETLPPLVYTFRGGLTVEVPATQYYNSFGVPFYGALDYQLSLYDNGGYSLLGDAFLRDKWVHFDIANNRI
eukprot:Ihof_evm3s782 gene=Ihof_evmTU3s782